MGLRLEYLPPYVDAMGEAPPDCHHLAAETEDVNIADLLTHPDHESDCVTKDGNGDDCGCGHEHGEDDDNGSDDMAYSDAGSDAGIPPARKGFRCPSVYFVAGAVCRD
jgi:hypothetical protein